jgi:hypothetical protein
MHFLRHLTIALILLHLNPMASGQDGSGPVPFPRDRALSYFHYAEPSDSADFLQFIQSLRAEAGPTHTAGTPKRYRQVWLVSEHGGFATVSRGDGQVITLEEEQSTVGIFDTLFLHMRTTDGRTCVAVFWERPCAMICRTTTYYLEQ